MILWISRLAASSSPARLSPAATLACKSKFDELSPDSASPEKLDGNGVYVCPEDRSDDGRRGSQRARVKYRPAASEPVK